MKQRRKGRRRNSWEVYWTIGNQQYLVQESDYNRVMQRMTWLEAQQVRHRGFRQIQR